MLKTISTSCLNNMLVALGIQSRVCWEGQCFVGTLEPHKSLSLLLYTLYQVGPIPKQRKTNYSTKQ